MTYGGRAYIVVNDPPVGTLPTNSDYFALSSDKGDKGEKGEKGNTGDKGDKGNKGDRGDDGVSPTIAVGEVTTGEPDTPASVINAGNEQNVVLDITIPRGIKGEKGETGNKGDQGEDGVSPTISIGKIVTGEPGTLADIVNVGTTQNVVLDITIPRGNEGKKGDTGGKGDRGDDGASPTIAIGDVVTGEPGTQASVVNVGTEHNIVLDITIPRGMQGLAGAGSGDMNTDTYDANRDGVVDDAERLGGKPPSFYAQAEHEHNQYLTSETDPTVPSWAKHPNKPAYTAAEVNAVPVTRKIAGKTLDKDVTLEPADIGAAAESHKHNLENVTGLPTVLDGKADASHGHAPEDIGELTEILSKKSNTDHSHDRYLTQEADPTVPDWAKEAQKPAYKVSEIEGAVPNTRKVNGKALSANITLQASDVGAEAARLTFLDTSVTAATWKADTTHTGYGYRASVALSGVTSDMVPEVIFGVFDALNGNYAPVCEAYNGGVYVYAKDAPATMTIPTIIIWR